MSLREKRKKKKMKMAELEDATIRPDRIDDLPEESHPANSPSLLYSLPEAEDQNEKTISMFLVKSNRENEEKEVGKEKRGTQYTVAGQSLKEKYAKLRSRQKRKIAIRKASQSSGLVATETPLIPIPSNKEKGFASDLYSRKLKKPISQPNKRSGMNMWRGSSSTSGHAIKSTEDLFIRPRNQRPYDLSADLLSNSPICYKNPILLSLLNSPGLDFPSRLMLGENAKSNMIKS